MQAYDCIVIGAGAAGLSCAVKLAKHHRVLLLEKNDFLGGRTSSQKDHQSKEDIDNGQHLMLGCYHETLQYLKSTNSLHLLEFIQSRSIAFKGHETHVLNMNGPMPFALLLGLLRFKAINFKERLGFLNVLFDLLCAQDRLSTMSVLDWLRSRKQSDRVINVFWEPLVLATLNAPLDKISADMLHVVLKRGFLSSKKNSQMILSKVGLSELFGRNVLKILQKNNGDVRLRCRVLDIKSQPDQSVLIRSSQESFYAKSLVLAVPPPALLKLQLDQELWQSFAPAGRLEHAPIVSVYVWLKNPRDVPMFCALLGTKFHWMFNRSHFILDAKHITFLASACDPLIKMDSIELKKIVENEFYQHFGRHNIISRILIRKEPQATYYHSLHDRQARLKTKTLSQNVFLAGDWTDTGLPCTIESAVFSGHKAAQNVLEFFCQE